jgi:starch-binding outer membrane protein, SusD/RagB family
MKKYAILLFMAVASVQGCKKLDVGLANELNSNDFWQTEADAMAVLAACYENMYSSGAFFYTEALSDNAYYKSGDGYGSANKVANGSYDPSTQRIKDDWSYYYNAIRKCNQFLANVERVPGLEATKLRRMQAEARFIRAHSYFQLANWYGDVPLFTDVISLSESKTIARAPHAQVVDFVLTELAAIQADLPINTTLPAAERGRITRGAAIGLKARVNLQEGNWQGVVTACEELINKPENGSYSLFNSYSGLFAVANEYNSEVILDLQFGANRVYDTQRFFLPVTIGQLRSDLVPTQALVDNYAMNNGKAIGEAGSGYDANDPYANRDPRFYATIVYHGAKLRNFDFQGGTEQTILTLPGSNPSDNTATQQYASASGYYFRKYYDPTAANYNSGLNLIMIRYADILLMYAEAKTELGQMNAAVWDQTIRPIRTRAGFSDPAALDFNAGLNQGQLRDVVRQERRSELAFEGLRPYDIRRWKTAETVLKGTVTGMRIPGNELPKDATGHIIVETRVFQAPRHYLWPVPQFERDQNPNLGQNTGW